MNVRELQNTESQPHWWLFVVIGLPVTILAVVFLWRGRRMWRNYRLKREPSWRRLYRDHEAAYSLPELKQNGGAW